MYNVRDKGILGKHGWTTKNSDKERQRSIIKAIYETDINRVCKQLNHHLRGNILRDTEKKIEFDLNFVYENFGYPAWEQKKVWYHDILFDSQEERDCYKYCEIRNIRFQHQYPLGNNKIDFFIPKYQNFYIKEIKVEFTLQKDLFIEHHPNNPCYVFNDDDLSKYKETRNRIINKFYDQQYGLIVTKNVSNFKETVRDTLFIYNLEGKDNPRIVLIKKISERKDFNRIYDFDEYKQEIMNHIDKYCIKFNGDKLKMSDNELRKTFPPKVKKIQKNIEKKEKTAWQDWYDKLNENLKN